MNCHSVIISLASNHDQEENLRRARLCLERVLSACRYTDSIWTEPHPSSTPSSLPIYPPSSPHLPPSTPKYLNQLVTATTDFPAIALQQFLKAVERHLGRCDSDRLHGIVRIDLDLLQHGSQRYHLSDWNRPYVRELIGNLL